MTTNARKGLLHSSMILGILGALLVATAIGASAMIPKPGQQTIRDGFIFTDLTGYQSPGGGTNCNAYAPNSTASFSATVRNRFNARDQAMSIEIYRMTVLSTNTCYTEAQLENMVLTGRNGAETLVATTSSPSQHYAFDETHSVGGSFSATCGYYQFDMGQTGTGPFAPRAGYAGPPVSGFVLFNGPQCNTASGTLGSGTTVTPVHKTTGSGAGAANLANTGGGSGTAPVGSALALLAGLFLVAVGLRTHRGLQR